MKQNLLTKHCALMLLALAAAWSTQAWALTINVNVTGNQEPYVYAWDNTGELTGSFPGTQLTNTREVGGKTWHYIDIDATSINVILSFGNNATQTGNITGITGTRYFEFANNNANDVTDLFHYPNGVSDDNDNYAYLVNVNGWTNVYAYVYNGDNNNAAWPGEKMTKVGTNINGYDIYKWTGTNPSNPQKIIFNNNSGAQSSDLEWENGGCWSNYDFSINGVVNGVLLDVDHFPDANMRSALTSATGVQENGVIATKNVTVLDVSNNNISNLEGISNFTNLEELYAQDNSINTSIDLKNNKKLRILNVSGNSALTGFSANHTPYVDINFGLGSNTTNLEELYCGNCSIFYAGGLVYNTGLKVLSMPHNVLDYFDKDNTMSKLSNLEYLDMSYNKLTSAQSLSKNTKLVYVDVSENPTFNSYFTHLENLTQLKTFKAANCRLTADQTKYSSSNGYFPNESVEYVDVSNNPALNTMYCPATNNLKTLIVNGCTGLQGSSSAGALGGSSTYIPRMAHLEHLELNNVDLYLHTGASNGLFTLLTPSVAPNLHYIDLSNDNLGSAAKPIFAFPALDTLLINDNPALTELTVTSLNAPERFNLDVTNDAALTTVAITNSGMTQATMPTITATGATSLYKLDLTNNAFTDVPTTGISTLTTLVMNNNQLSDINVSESNIHYLYAQNNNFGSVDYTLPTTSLVGLDLGNNGFTKFKAENNTSLKSLALAGNTNLTEIELHGNTALTQTSPDGIIESDNGLYIRGLSNLQTLNIENSSFNKLGQQNSLEGVTGLKKLQARHNEFTTFTNGVYPVGVQGTGSYRIPDPDESSLEHLTALEYLDLAYNNLQDSVHLYKNVALKHLDVSHNNEIHGVIDGTIDPNDAAAVEAMIIKKGKNLMKYGRVYGKDPNNPNASPTPGWNPSTDEWTAGYTNLHALRSRPFDLRLEDLNDTTGLYHLDLGKNVNLEWLDISYTNIHNTAAGPSFMNPGWMDTDWVTDMGTFAGRPSQNTTAHRAYMSWHTFVYIIPCSKLKTLHMDHNNMQSMGVRYFPELDTLTSSYMYGDCALMRDFNKTGVVISDEELRYGYGNTGLSGAVVKYTGDENLTTNSDGIVTNLEGSYTNPTKYVDVSHSGFNSFHVFNGVNLEYLDVSGNPLNYNVPWNDLTKSYYNSLDVTYCPNIRTVLAENCSDLPIVRAHNRTKLDTLYLSNDPKLKTLYVQNDPLLKTNFAGLNTLTGLETLFGYNNTQWGNDITFASNTALKNLWVSNIGAQSLDVSHNTALEKLRAYDNSLTDLDLSNNGELLWLDVARNKLPEIDLSGNTKLQFFNISNGSDTRTQLDGTEALNHDGSDGDNIKPITVFNADDAPIANANDGNSLSDLVLPASIIDARANGNDLHSIKPVQGGSFTNLDNIEFAHNHINGIDLSDAPSATIESRDNGRTIVADFATFKVKDNNNQIQEYKVYFFQLENPEKPNGTILTDKESKDLKLASRHLGDDGLTLNKIRGWDSENSGMLKSGTTVTPSNMDDILDPDQIPGNIVVLVPEDVNESTNEASGHATYTYTTGAGSEGSEFYLNWTSNGTVTGLNIVGMPLDNVSITNTYGNLTVAGADGTVVGVYDLNGRQVASETISGGTLTIDGLAPGIYIVNGVKVVVK